MFFAHRKRVRPRHRSPAVPNPPRASLSSFCRRVSRVLNIKAYPYHHKSSQNEAPFDLCGDAIYYLFCSAPKGSHYAPRRSWPLQWVEGSAALTQERVSTPSSSSLARTPNWSAEAARSSKITNDRPYRAQVSDREQKEARRSTATDVC